MIIQYVITILKLVLFIQNSHSFKPPKHNVLSYYKTVNNVFLANPKNHSTSYGVYVAGETITVDVSKSVVNVSTIVNWKVINVDRDRLMFVHNKKPQILINQKTIKEMKYSRQLNGSIIALGENEALHVPTIFNQYVSKPNSEWNYLELLSFNVADESVSIISSLPWFKDDDWKYITNWEMTDYIHFDHKLYLLIKRSIRNEQAANVTQELSIIRLFLDKGNQLFSSAVEIHYTRPEFQNNQIIGAVFQLHTKRDSKDLGLSFKDINQNFENISKRLTLFIRVENFSQERNDSEHFIAQFEQLFDISQEKCASGVESSVVTLLQYRLRSQFIDCKNSSYKSSSSKTNFVPSYDITNEKVVTVKAKLYLQTDKSAIVKHQTVSFLHPFYQSWSYRIQNNLSTTYICLEFMNTEQNCKTGNFFGSNFASDIQPQFYVNQRPLGGFLVTKVANEIVFYDENLNCEQFKSCIYCIMYGLYFGCVWSYSSFGAICTYDAQVKPKTKLTLNHCFKITQISPFISSSIESLTVQIDQPLNIDDSQESLVINAGPHNYCTNVTIDGLNIECSMHSFKRGRFQVDLKIVSNKYADVAIVSSISTDAVDIFLPEVEDGNMSTLMRILFFGLLFSAFLLTAYTRFSKEQLGMFKKIVASKIAKGLEVAQSAIERAKSRISSYRANRLNK